MVVLQDMTIPPVPRPETERFYIPDPFIPVHREGVEPTPDVTVVPPRLLAGTVEKVVNLGDVEVFAKQHSVLVDKIPVADNRPRKTFDDPKTAYKVFEYHGRMRLPAAFIWYRGARTGHPWLRKLRKCRKCARSKLCVHVQKYDSFTVRRQRSHVPGAG